MAGDMIAWFFWFIIELFFAICAIRWMPKRYRFVSRVAFLGSILTVIRLAYFWFLLYQWQAGNAENVGSFSLAFLFPESSIFQGSTSTSAEKLLFSAILLVGSFTLGTVLAATERMIALLETRVAVLRDRFGLKQDAR